MQQEYLLDTNAFFFFLKAMNPCSPTKGELPDQLTELLTEKISISSITKVEIISVLGKYARGNSGGIQKCNCIISKQGDLCQNSRYLQARKKWNNRKIKAWLQLIREIVDGRSKLLNVEIESFDQNTVFEAEKIIMHALSNNFASMDAMIAATAKIAREHKREVAVITSDKGLKACLDKCGIPYYDWFA